MARTKRTPNAKTIAAIEAAERGETTKINDISEIIKPFPTPAGVLVKVRVEPRLADRIQPMLAARGLTLDQAVGLYLRAMINSSERSKALRLTDAMPFGKYEGEVVETIIRAEPGYIQFLIANSAHARWDPEVLRLLEELTEQR
jgi:antitoxin component of RelBE/YafQ-DinJ toxin-antitoxin module